MTVRDRSGELAFTLEGVRLLDRVQALAMEPRRIAQSRVPRHASRVLGLTQAELGRLVGRDKLTISRWERGALRPGPDALRKFYELARKRKHKGVVLAG